MNMIDLTGAIRDGMWNYEEPFPKFRMRPLGRVPWVEGEVYCEVFEGMHSQTGTYLETPAHFFGNEYSYCVSDIPIWRLVDIPCTVLMLDERDFDIRGGRKPIDASMLEACAGSRPIPEASAILVGTGWGKHWMDARYLDASPYFTYDAMQWLIKKRPILLASDLPRWDNTAKSEGFFQAFYEADILMLAPCVNVEQIRKREVKLTVLPLHIPGTSAVPCRAIAREVEDQRDGE